MVVVAKGSRGCHYLWWWWPRASKSVIIYGGVNQGKQECDYLIGDG